MILYVLFLELGILFNKTNFSDYILPLYGFSNEAKKVLADFLNKSSKKFKKQDFVFRYFKARKQSFMDNYKSGGSETLPSFISYCSGLIQVMRKMVESYFPEIFEKFKYCFKKSIGELKNRISEVINDELSKRKFILGQQIFNFLEEIDCSQGIKECANTALKKFQWIVF